MSSKQLPFDEKNYLKGIERKKSGKNFTYYYIKNKKSVTKKDLNRIKKLGIPPGWIDVWISADPKSSIQVTGLDSKDRKQYRYNETHIHDAEQKKFFRLYDFIKSMPKLEKILNKHKSNKSYSMERVIVSMLTIVKELHMRVGKECYAKTNKSYGVSSLRKIHVKIKGDTLYFKFKGKSNKRVSYTLKNKELKTHIKCLLKLEGDKLFQYIDQEDVIRRVTDTDLNQYIQKHMGEQFTCKDFRTYASNHYFIREILNETKKKPPTDDKSIKKNISNAIKKTAFYLRHTAAISKKSYITEFFVYIYKDNPEYFVKRKDDETNDVLLDLLKKYKRNVLKK